ncbi:MAG TPA: hypothetical protein VH496_12280 [Mycobacterium sp.]
MALTTMLLASVLPACGNHSEVAERTSTSRASTTSSTSPTTTTAIAAPRTVRWVDLDGGQCVKALPNVELGDVNVTVVDCTTPHQAEAYFRGALTVNAAIPTVANPTCAKEFHNYTGRSVDNSGLAITYLVDSNQDRTTVAPTAGPAPSTVICLLQDANGEPLTGSARH